MRVRNQGALTDGLQYSALDLGTVVDDGAVGIIVAGGESRTSSGHSTGRHPSRVRRVCPTPRRSSTDSDAAAAIERGRHDDVRLLDSGGTPALL